MSLRVVILAGGSGTRFWPAGRRSRPKQVLALAGTDPRSLVRLTWDRLADLGRERPWVVAPASLARRLRSLLPDLERDGLVREPQPRNTAAALLLAAHLARHHAPETPLLAVPADHHVAPRGRYRAALRAMASRARAGEAIVTLGLRPTHAATGYGYLRVGRRVGRTGGGDVHVVERYVEKPPPGRARRLASDGRHLFNGGTFAFLPRRLLEEGEAHLPRVARPLAEAFSHYGTRRFRAALTAAYERLPSISVDYGIMERTRRVEVVAADLDWDDLGSWDAVGRHLPRDRAGNRRRGDVVLLGSRDCVAVSEAGHVALLDVEGLVVVRTRDAVLVTRRGRGERVRDLVARLRARGREDLLA